MRFLLSALMVLSMLPTTSGSQHDAPARLPASSAPPPRRVGTGPNDAQRSPGEPEAASELSTAEDSQETLGADGPGSEGTAALAELGVSDGGRGSDPATDERQRRPRRRTSEARRRRRTTSEARRRSRSPLTLVTTRQPYQPPIPPAEPTPKAFWNFGARPMASKLVSQQCPPWLPGYKTGKGSWKTHCTCDAVALCVRLIEPNNRCGPGGVCQRGIKNRPGSIWEKIYREVRSCVTFNKGKWYPEYNQAGFCITARPVGKAHNLAYNEKVLAVNPHTKMFYTKAIAWAQRDAPARLTCDSFCKGCDKATEYCADTADSPIAAGEHGNCDCFCRAGSRAADFDRCTTVSRSVCTSAAYCGGHGQAAFTPTRGQDEGTCGCSCVEGWRGRNCELEDGKPCNINDCNHRTAPVEGGHGIRPNCKCKCGGGMFNFGGPNCSDWTFGRKGNLGSTSTNFTIQGKGSE